MRFEVLSGSTIIGHSDLEKGDPPMGVAHGRFFPSAAYAIFKPEFLATREGLSQEHLLLSVRLIEGEVLIPIYIQICDFSEELDELQIDVCGMDSVQYQRLFPHLVLAYENQFGG